MYFFKVDEPVEDPTFLDDATKGIVFLMPHLN